MGLASLALIGDSVVTLEGGSVLYLQTWESVKPGVPKEVKGGYPEIKS